MPARRSRGSISRWMYAASPASWWCRLRLRTGGLPARPGGGGGMRVTIGAKIFGIAVGLLLLMGAVAWLSTRLTQTVDEQLVVLDRDSFPGYIEFAHANIHTVEESALIRRVLLAFDQGETATGAKVPALLQRVAVAAKASDDELAEARRLINALIAQPSEFHDHVALARLDTRVEFLQEERRHYE